MKEYFSSEKGFVIIMPLCKGLNYVQFMGAEKVLVLGSNLGLCSLTAHYRSFQQRLAEPLFEADIRRVFKAVATAVSDLHYQDLLHGDIVPENILFKDEDGQEVVVCGFGNALKRDEITMDDPPEFLGDPEFQPPEMAEGSNLKISLRSDVWSLGCLLFYMVCAQSPFGDDDSERMAQRKRSGQFDFSHPNWKLVDEGIQDLLRQMLMVDECDRMGLPGCLAHPWVQADYRGENDFKQVRQELRDQLLQAEETRQKILEEEKKRRRKERRERKEKKKRKKERERERLKQKKRRAKTGDSSSMISPAQRRVAAGWQQSSPSLCSANVAEAAQGSNKPPSSPVIGKKASTVDLIAMDSNDSSSSGRGVTIEGEASASLSPSGRRPPRPVIQRISSNAAMKGTTMEGRQASTSSPAIPNKRMKRLSDDEESDSDEDENDGSDELRSSQERGRRELSSSGAASSGWLSIPRSPSSTESLASTATTPTIGRRANISPPTSPSRSRPPAPAIMLSPRGRRRAEGDSGTASTIAAQPIATRSGSDDSTASASPPSTPSRPLSGMKNARRASLVLDAPVDLSNAGTGSSPLSASISDFPRSFSATEDLESPRNHTADDDVIQLRAKKRSSTSTRKHLSSVVTSTASAFVPSKLNKPSGSAPAPGASSASDPEATEGDKEQERIKKWALLEKKWEEEDRIKERETREAQLELEREKETQRRIREEAKRLKKEQKRKEKERAAAGASTPAVSIGPVVWKHTDGLAKVFGDEVPEDVLQGDGEY